MRSYTKIFKEEFSRFAPTYENYKRNKNRTLKDSTAKKHMNNLILFNNDVYKKINTEKILDLEGAQLEWAKIRKELLEISEWLKINIDLEEKLANIKLYKLFEIDGDETNMAAFDLNLAFKLEALKSTESRKIIEFVAQAEFMYNEFDSEGKEKFIKFLTSCKIIGEAKVRLGHTVPTTFVDLKNQLLSKVLARETSEQIQEEIARSRQGYGTLAEFATKLEDLADRLASAMIRETNITEGGQQETVRETCRKVALGQFKKTCHEEVKVVVAAARPQTLDEALAVASASNLDPAPRAQINTFRGQNYRGRGNYRGRNNNNNYRGNGRGRGNYRGRNNNYRGNGRGKNHNNNQNKNQNSQNNNRNNSNSYNGNNNNNSHRNNNYNRRNNSGYTVQENRETSP